MSCSALSRGRFETKNNRLPSGLRNRSQSFQRPENEATFGGAHLLLTIFEKHTVGKTVNWQKYTVLPSGVKEATDSPKGVETIPGAKTSTFAPVSIIFCCWTLCPNAEKMA